jgi:ADP-dependent NAD(P)H-hydrate dehydratase / NAD(P)H-hydrate epimerase
MPAGRPDCNCPVWERLDRSMSVPGGMMARQRGQVQQGAATRAGASPRPATAAMTGGSVERSDGGATGDVLRAWPVGAIRAVEGDLLERTPPGGLMQRAAAGLAAVCLRELRSRGRVRGSRAVLLIGAGNNGGDALWAGARLAGRGVTVDAVQLGSTVHAEGLAALRAAGGRLVPIADGAHGEGGDGEDGDGEGADGEGGEGGDRNGEGDAAAIPAGEVEALLRRADLVVDGLVGIGGSPGLREPAAGLVATLDSLRAHGAGPLVVGVDLPSGVDPDTGETPAAHVRADVTVTFGAPKPCLLLPPADRAAGRLEVVDIGLMPGLQAAHEPAVERLTTAGAAARWPVPGAQDDKYRRGVVGVVAGSPAYTGAAVLAVGGALRAGAGMVRYVGPEHPAEQVRMHWPEAVVGSGRVQAWVLGSGVDPDADDGQADAVRAGLASGLPCVVDAGALALLADDPSLREALSERTVLTPHAGELARLLTAVRADRDGDGTEVERAEVEARPLAAAREVVAATGATVLVKGATTLVVPPNGAVRSVSRAPAWLATAGAGDVLAGVLGTLLAAGLDPADAAALAADIHGRAATLASHGDMEDGPGGPILATDVVGAVPAVVRALLAGRG